MIPEQVQSPATVRHATCQVKMITERLNPGQPAVITGDQPVYALGKQVQWMFPNELKDVIWLLGPLHIEKNFLEAIGKWLEGSGWKKIYEYSAIVTSGKADALLKCAGKSGIKRVRYAQQVTLGALQTLCNEAYETQSERSDFDVWRDNLEKNQQQQNFGLQ